MIDKKKNVTVLAKDFGKKFNGPNDLWIDPMGEFILLTVLQRVLDAH
jgi:hypothetical protein